MSINGIYVNHWHHVSILGVCLNYIGPSGVLRNVMLKVQRIVPK